MPTSEPPADRNFAIAEIERPAPAAVLTLQDISILGVLNAQLRHRRLLLVLPVALALLVGIATILWPKKYTVTATFMAQDNGSAASNLSALAAQFGVTIGSAAGSQSPDFYADLLKSPPVLQRIVEKKYSFVFNDDTIRNKDLRDIFDESGETPGERTRSAMDDLTDDISVSADATTNVITVAVTTKWAPLSLMITQEFVDYANQFNLASRQQTAGAEKTFAEQRMKEMDDEVHAAEMRLADFMNHNKQYRTDPALSAEYDNLQRQVSMRQQIATSLAQSYEQARIDAVRNTPTLIPVQQAQLPLAADKKKLIIKVALGLIGGVFLAMMIAIALELMRGARVVAPEYESFVALRNDTLADAKRLLPWRWGRRRAS